jgi:Na+-transporting methylmalonyl-CoA/oxaloacetate decarboxylase gamma subunit
VGKVSRILQSPVDKHLLIFLGTHGINWIGEDCGRKIKALNHGRRIKEFVFHPTERNWGLASAFTLCEDFVGEPCKIYKELFVTRDLGENWELIGSYIVQFSWGITDESHIKAGVPKERILVTHEPRGRGDQHHSGWNYKIDFIYSDDFFKTRRNAAHKGNKFMITKNYLFVAQVVDQESQEVVLLGSASDHKEYDLQPIETNMKKFREHSYTFLDTSEGSVFLHINHFGEISKYGHIYISDASGIKYSQSLKYNVRSYENQCDFEKVNSLEGIYIGNVISSSYMQSAEQEIEEEEIKAMESMEDNKPKRSKAAFKSETDVEYKDFIKTLISFSKGGNWRRIPAPARNREGGQYDCGEHCYLNLHGVSSDYPPYYSVESAAGLIIANGNVGRYLSHNEDDVSTFLSRDGGLNWFEIRKGSHIYEIGDHGALILIAGDKTPTNSIFYSWDEGLTFEELRISDERIQISNIIIEPTSTSQHFIVYGESATKKGEKKGVVIGLDFSSLHEPQCRNPDSPDTNESDYEKWTPNDGRGGKECLLGRKVTYIRRKREAQCYNGLDYERKVTIENCHCTEDDYECDVGYERAGPGEPCVSSRAIDKILSFELHTPPTDCHGFYSISKGYRKVPGNTCVNGVKFDPIVIPCPYTGIFASVGFIFFVLIILVLIVLIVIAFNKNFFQNVSDVVKQKMKDSQTNRRQKEDYVNIVRNESIIFF